MHSCILTSAPRADCAMCKFPASGWYFTFIVSPIDHLEEPRLQLGLLPARHFCRVLRQRWRINCRRKVAGIVCELRGPLRWRKRRRDMADLVASPAAWHLGYWPHHLVLRFHMMPHRRSPSKELRAAGFRAPVWRCACVAPWWLGYPSSYDKRQRKVSTKPSCESQ